MKTLFVAPYTLSAVDAIKVSALYFDEVVINERELVEVEPAVEEAPPHLRKGLDKFNKVGKVTAIFSTVDDELIEATRPLIDENVVRIVPASDNQWFQGELINPLRSEFLKLTDVLLNHTEGKDGTHHLQLDRGAAEVYARLAGPLDVGAIVTLNPIITYFEGLFVESIKAASAGQSVLSSSPALHRLIESAAQSPALRAPELSEAFKNYSTPRFAADVLEAGFINTSGLGCDEILEARLKLRDELGAFRQELKVLEYEFSKEFGIEKVYREGREIAKIKLSRPVRELESKIKSGQIHVLRRLLDELQKPGAYVPVLGSFFAGLPLDVALALSAGIVSLKAALEAAEEHAKLASNGLFYLVKLSSFLKGKISTPPKLIPREPPLRNKVLAWPHDTLVQKS